HRDPVHREELVVSLGLHEVALGRQELQTDQEGEEAAQEEEKGDGGEVQERDPLVVPRQEPGPHAVGGGQVVLAGQLRLGLVDGGGHYRVFSFEDGVGGAARL